MQMSPEKIHHRRWVILGVLCLSLVLVVINNSVLNVAIPTMVRSLRAPFSQMQWIVDAYALVFGGLLLTAGTLGDRYGRKPALQIGLVVIGVFSGLSAFATEPGQLVATRALMGVGAAFVMPATLSILTNVFPPQERGKAIGIWAAFAGLGGAIGPIVGGWLLEHFWWGSIFFLNVPVILIALLLGIWLVPNSKDPTHTALDLRGAALSIVALGSLLYAIIEGPESGWTDPLILGGFAVFAASAGAFVWWELRTPHPMLDVRLFRKPGMSVGVSSISMTFFAMFGMFFLMTQYLQFVQGYSPLAAGVRTLPMAFGLVLSSPNSDRFAGRFGANRVVASGLVLVACGFVTLAFLNVGSAYWNIGLAFLVIGLGMGGAMAPSTGSIMNSLPLAKAGVGSAVNDTSREIGGAIGIAVLGSILNSGYRAGIAESIPPAVPEQVRAALDEGLGVALEVARTLPERLTGAVPGPTGPLDPGAIAAEIARVAKEAYVGGMRTAFVVAALIAVVAAAIAARWLPAHTRGQDLPADLAAGAAADQAAEP
ncbi:MAG: MFS transporter [Acidimicrobiia bacterium]|nr:MFS transporter [Acidimicrobiia bacterium]